MRIVLVVLFASLFFTLPAGAAEKNFIGVINSLNGQQIIVQEPGSTGFADVQIESSGDDFVCLRFLAMGFVRCYPQSSILWVTVEGREGRESGAPAVIMVSDM